MSSRFIHVISCVRITDFLRLNNILWCYITHFVSAFYCSMYHILLIDICNISTFLDTVSNVAVNIAILISEFLL
jgi:hypothetical protein